MKNLILFLMLLWILNPDACHKSTNKPASAPATSVGQWSAWQSISSYPLKARYRHHDEIGNGNFAWEIQFENNDLTLLHFTYRIDFEKGDGTQSFLEDTTQIGPGDSQGPKLSAAKITRVRASEVTRVTH